MRTVPLIQELFRKRINENTDLSPLYRVIRIQVRGQGQVGNEFQKNKRFSELERFGRRVGGGIFWPTVGHHRDLCMWML